MAEIEKIKNGFLFICDCGIEHKITKNNEDEIIIKSIVPKKEEEKKDGKKSNGSERSEDKFWF